MESENVAVVRRVHELFNRLDPDPDVRASSPEAEELLELFDADVEFIQPPRALDSTEHRGRESFEQSWVEWLAVWEEIRAEVSEITESGDSVLALSRNRFTGRDGIEVEVHGGGIFTLAEGRIVRMRAFFEADEARRVFASEHDEPG